MPSGRLRYVARNRAPVKDKRKPIEVWEDGVFANADYFTVTRFLGQGQRERYDYPVSRFNDAMAFARYPRAPQEGKPFGVYVVGKDGRSVCLERSKDEHWKALWQTHHATA